MLKIVKKTFSKLLPKNHFISLFLHELSAKRNTHQSFAGENAKINEILKSLQIRDGYAIDIAASDGLSQSCTYHFFNSGWAGLCVEMDPIKFSKLACLYREFGNVALEKVRVTPNNVGAVLNSAECPQNFEFLNLDIDSYDLHVIRKILENGYRPQLISLEINEKIPSAVFFTVDFDEGHYWKGDHFYGCSITAASSLMEEFGYSLINLEWNNAFFIPNALIEKSNLDPLCPHKAYELGYKNRSDRLVIFPWNSNVDYWQSLGTDLAISEIEKYFSKYQGKFTCKKFF